MYNDEQIEALSEYINGTFMWDFRKGDNIIYNFKILWALYNGKEKYIGDTSLYNKPIMIIIISIIECILEDFTRRIQNRIIDPLPNITTQIIDDFKYVGNGKNVAFKKLEKFNHYIQMVEKHNIFGLNKSNYKALNKLKDIRNKVHIQSSNENEVPSFDEKNLKLSEKVLEGVIKQMIIKYPRSWGKTFNENKFNNMLPWKTI